MYRWNYKTEALVWKDFFLLNSWRKWARTKKKYRGQKTLKIFLKSRGGRNPGNSWFKLFPKQIPIWKYVWHIPLHYSSTHDLLQPLFLTFLEQQLPSLVMTQNLIFKSVCICSKKPCGFPDSGHPSWLHIEQKPCHYLEESARSENSAAASPAMASVKFCVSDSTFRFRFLLAYTYNFSHTYLPPWGVRHVLMFWH